MKRMLCLKCLLDCPEQFGLLFQVPGISKALQTARSDQNANTKNSFKTNFHVLVSGWCREIWVRAVARCHYLEKDT